MVCYAFWPFWVLASVRAARPLSAGPGNEIWNFTEILYGVFYLVKNCLKNKVSLPRPCWNNKLWSVVILVIPGICGVSSWRASFVQAWGIRYWSVDDCVIQIEDYCTPTNHILKIGGVSLWLWEILSSEMPFLHLFAWGSLFASLQNSPRIHWKYCKIEWKYILSLTKVMYDS